MNEKVFIIRCWDDAAKASSEPVWRYRVLGDEPEKPQYFSSLQAVTDFVRKSLRR